MKVVDRHQPIPSIENTGISPMALRRRIERTTGRAVLLRHFDQFYADYVSRANTPDELLSYGILTVFFPRCIAAVLDGSEQVGNAMGPLVLLARPFPGCKHTLSALYDWHPINDSPWNDGLFDHVRIWTWKQCEVCAAAELAKRGIIQ